MKKLFIYLILSAGLILSCDDNLDVEPESVITFESFWSSDEDAIAARNGLYNQFRNTFNGRQFLYKFEFRTGFWQFGESGGGVGTAEWRDLFNNDINFSTTPGLDWGEYYEVINSANLILKFAPDLDFRNETTKNQILSDAYFARAYTYFAIARFWGDVPLVLSGFESDSDPDLFPTRTTIEEVFVQIKADASAALDAIPDSNSRERIFASRAAINMLIADVNLWTAKRIEGGTNDIDVAEMAVEAVLADENYRLLDDYEDVFRNPLNDEIILSLLFEVGEAENHFSNQFAFQAAPVPLEFQNNPVPIGITQWTTFTDFYINNWLLKEPLDRRSGIINQDFDEGNRIFRYVNKYLGELNGGTRFFVDDTPIYRYAEAILFKAEILAAKDEIAAGTDELNLIAERAYGIENYYGTVAPAPGNRQELEGAILNERLIEFGAEGKAWFDMIRFDMAFELIPSLMGREGDYQGNILLLPVSNQTISANPSITQTPGF